MTQVPMPSNAQPCPIWGDTPSAGDIPEPGLPLTSQRAGGRFLLMQSGAALLQHRLLTDRQRANLSYWIYHHNLRYRLFDESPGLREAPPVLNEEWVEGHRDRTPSSLDRLLTFLRELIRCEDAGQRPRKEWLLAAGGCWREDDLEALFQYGHERGLIGGVSNVDSGAEWVQILNLAKPSLEARIHVEEELGEIAESQQGFVAMWFDNSMNEVYKDGIAPAIEAAGYDPFRIDRKEFTGGVTDEIMAEIRQSKFVVADFTSCRACTACEKCKHVGTRGGVYYEAGFAEGRNITVIHTCHTDCVEALHFDTSHINHLVWENSADLRTKLQNRIEAVLGRGPINPSTDRNGRPAG